MIKIFFKNPHVRFFHRGQSPNAERNAIMRSHGVQVVGNEKAADIVIITSDGWAPEGGRGGYPFDNIKKVAEQIGKPVIVTERSDTAKTWYRDGKRVAENVIAIFKNRVTRSIEIENTYDFQDKTRAWAAPALRKGKDLPIISQELYDKIHPVLWDWHSSHLMSFCQFYNKRQPMPMDKRGTAVFCVNNDRPGKKHGKLRTKAKHLIDKWGKKNNLRVQTTGMSQGAYQSKFTTSKIAVGCWGHGEWVHIDGYSFFNKTILIKPKCDYIYQWPDLYRSNETYIPCKPDYSDLQDVLDEVYSNYNNYSDMLESNREMLAKATWQRSLKVFCQTIQKVYNK